MNYSYFGGPHDGQPVDLQGRDAAAVYLIGRDEWRAVDRYYIRHPHEPRYCWTKGIPDPRTHRPAMDGDQ